MQPFYELTRWRRDRPSPAAEVLFIMDKLEFPPISLSGHRPVMPQVGRFSLSQQAGHCRDYPTNTLSIQHVPLPPVLMNAAPLL